MNPRYIIGHILFVSKYVLLSEKAWEFYQHSQ